MKIGFSAFNQNFKPAFGKIELGSVTVRKKDSGLVDVKLVEYEPDNKADIKQLKRVQDKWGDKARFINSILAAFLGNNSDSILGLESNDGDTLVLADVCSTQYYGKQKKYCGSPCVYIDLIQVNPAHKYLPVNEDKKRYKGLGEAMVSEIVQMAKDEDTKFISITSANEGFWTNSGLFDVINPGIEGVSLPDMLLSSSKYDDYIKYVEDKKAEHIAKTAKGLDISV